MSLVAKFFLIILAVIMIIGGYLFYRNSDLGIGDNIGSQEASIITPETVEYIGPQVSPLILADETIHFPYTDDLSDESIIIKTNKKTYYDETGSDVYVSITNTNPNREKAALVFYFSGHKDDGVSFLELQKNGKWEFITFYKENIKVNQQLLGNALKKRNTMPDEFKAKAASQIEIPARETVYLKTKIAYKPGTEGEFWIEALGDKGSYGLLDPFYSSVTFRGGVTLRGGVAINKPSDDGGDSCSGTVEEDNVDSVAVDGGVSLATVEDFTTGSGSDRLMLIGVSMQNTDSAGPVSVDSITYNGSSVGITQVDRVAVADDSAVEIWRLVAPPSVTGDVVVNFDLTLDAEDGAAIVGVMTFNCVDQATPLGAFFSDGDDSNGTTLQVNVTSTAVGEIVFSTMHCEDCTSVAVGGGENPEWNHSTTGDDDGAGSTEAAVGSSVLMTWTIANPAHETLAAVAIKPSD